VNVVCRLTWPPAFDVTLKSLTPCVVWAELERLAANVEQPPSDPKVIGLKQPVS
jgi:hypothetical protein